ncbi:MAG: hypothetical protein COA78_06410 [Blastopirellula sp.]|nr:MAG: hypothetical protein COA78_06410 [Blastopirellula sp.]
MAKLLGIEWDSCEARIVLARPRSGGISVEDAFSVSLIQEESGEKITGTDIGKTVKQALESRNIKETECLVTVGRANIELHILQLPPAPDDELPGLVRFQALREFSNLGDDWPLDFVPLGKNENGQIEALSAALAPNAVKNIQTTCGHAGLSATHLVMRPLSAASLLERESRYSGKVSLLVDILADEVDLTIMSNQTVVFTRTTRLPGTLGSDEQAKSLQQEIRRTMIAAQDQLAGETIESVVILGSEEDLGKTRESLNERLDLPVELLNPFEHSLVRAATKTFPDFSGRYAPLLGLLIDQATSTRHAIDFLDPRKAPEPQNNKRTYSLAGIAAGLLIFMTGFMFYSQLGSMNTEITDLEFKLSKLQKSNKVMLAIQSDVEQIDQWNLNNIRWVDEMYRLSAKMPAAEETILNRLVMSGNAKEGGSIMLEGYASDEGVISSLHELLNDDTHKMSNKGNQQSDKLEKYYWSFKEAMSIATPDEELFVAIEPTTVKLETKSDSDDSELEPEAPVENGKYVTATEEEEE